MPHRVPTGKANIQVFKEETEKIYCPECGKSDYIKQTGDYDYFCEFCITIIKSNAHEVDEYFRDEYNFLVDVNGLDEGDE